MRTAVTTTTNKHTHTHTHTHTGGHVYIMTSRQTGTYRYTLVEGGKQEAAYQELHLEQRECVFVCVCERVGVRRYGLWSQQAHSLVPKRGATHTQTHTHTELIP